MSNLLRQILRDRGLDVSDDADADALYELIMEQDVEVQDEITREFARRLIAQHGSNTDVPDEYKGDKFPLHVLTFQVPFHVLTAQAVDDKRPWSDVDLVLRNLPPRMAKDNLMRTDSFNEHAPLHHAASGAPRSVIVRMLKLAPEAARVKAALGWLPLHLAARNNVDAIESLMNDYPDALLETNNGGDTPIDIAIDNGRGDEILKKAIKLACSNKFLNYGELLEDKSLYKQSINPINIILFEAIHKKRSPDDVVEFINELEQKRVVLTSLLNLSKSDTELPPIDLANEIEFETKASRVRVFHALSDDNKEGLALHNASTGLDDSPDVPDRLGRQPLAKACAQVLKEIETPHTSFTCSVTGGWGSGKTKFADMLLKEMMKRNKNIKKESERFPFTPTLTFIIVCILVKKYLYDMCLCRCLSKPSRSTPNAASIVSSQTDTEREPLLDDLEAEIPEIVEEISDASIVSSQANSESAPPLHVGSDADYDLTHLDMRELFYLLTFPISFPASYVYNLFQTGKTGTSIDEESGDDVQKLDENGEALIIALCIILLSPLVLLTMMFYYIVIETGQNFGHTRRVYKDSDKDRASLVLESIFKSQPANDLPCIVSITAFIVLYASRLSYAAYDKVSKCFNDFEPSLIRTSETRYIDARFNAWEYSGSDVLWASLIQKLYDEVKKEFSKKEFQIYKSVYDELDNKTPACISDKIEELVKRRKYLRLRIVAIVVLLIVGVMILLVYGLSQSSVKIVVAQVGAIVISIVTLAQYFKNIIHELHKVNKDTLQEAIDQVRSTARVPTGSEQKDKGRDYKVEKGFMGEIKEDVNCLMGYLRFQNARLVIVIDDLDRCKEKDIVDILQAVILLLIDSPITCFLAIDNRVVISVLDKYMEKLCSKEGITGQEYLDKIIQLPINIDIIDDVVKLDYIELSSEGKSLTVKNLLERINFFKNQKFFGDDFENWKKDVESVKDPTKRLHAAVTYLCNKPKPNLSVRVPSFDRIKGDNEKLEIFLFSVSRAMNNIIYSSGEENGVGGKTDKAHTYKHRGHVKSSTESESTLRPESGPVLDLSEYDRIYSPILSRRELNAFKDLLFIIPSNPRKIKRILNIYSLVRTYRSYRFNIVNSDMLTRKLLKFIILLERWPYATSLILEVVTRLDYERNDANNQVSLDEESYNANFDRRVLCNRILLYFKDLTEYKSLTLRCLYDALEQELLHCDAVSLRNMLSKDDDIRLFKTCLFHEDNDIILKVEDIAELRTFAFNLNSMLIDHAGRIIDVILCHTSRKDLFPSPLV